MSAAHTLTPEVLRQCPLPDPNRASDKNGRGRALVIAGSASVPGAAMLAGVAALRAGAGKIQFGVPRSIATALGIAFPECGLLCLEETEVGEPLPAPAPALSEAVEHADAVLIGPGLMDAAGATNLVTAALDAKAEAMFVLDALALCHLRSCRNLVNRRRKPVVLTPHHGEMAMLLGIEKEAIAREPLRFALSTAAELGCIVVLKSEVTYIASPEGQAWEHLGGVIGLATAGSGDVLAGILVGLLARGASPVTAALWAVHTHATAGRQLSDEVAPVGFLAREILDLIPRTLENSCRATAGR
jgi:ADP-dependent NAD(P)H-hydrate dehydratase